MAKDSILKAIETILSGTPAGIATQAPKKLKNLMEKYKKEKGITGKPKGRSPSMVLGSASKAGMQSKQGNTYSGRRKRLKPAPMPKLKPRPTGPKPVPMPKLKPRPTGPKPVPFPKGKKR